MRQSLETAAALFIVGLCLLSVIAALHAAHAGSAHWIDASRASWVSIDGQWSLCAPDTSGKLGCMAVPARVKACEGAEF
jgi:hypothetical protein